jgi:hypothetical protein
MKCNLTTHHGTESQANTNWVLAISALLTIIEFTKTFSGAHTTIKYPLIGAKNIFQMEGSPQQMTAPMSGASDSTASGGGEQENS